jgi:5-methylcytosine-specific restriction endonuclease McrA
MQLRKASGVEVVKDGFWFFAEHRIVVSKASTFTLHSGEYRQARAAIEAGRAFEVGRETDRVLWWAAEGFFWSDLGLDAEAVELLLWDRQRRQQSRLGRLRKLRDREAALAGRARERIPEDVRVSVWVRDDGRCARCGAEDDLQFDHVIPVARGGGNSFENVQVLCGDCNRLKSDAIV